MPVVVIVFTPDQEARVRELVAAGIQTWLDTPLPGSKDRDGKTFTPRQAMHRGVYGYDAVREGGVLEKRSDALEAADAADQLDDAAEAAEQDDIAAALAKPIRPAGAAG